MPWVRLQLSTFNFQHLMKILLLGEYSNVHNTLAKGLRALGHHVTVASNGDYWKNYPRDIDLARRCGRVGGMALYAKILKYLPRMRGYDVVQLINPLFIDLSAKRLFHIYNYIRKHNRKMVMGGFGMDYYWVSTCLNDKPLRYSDFNIGFYRSIGRTLIEGVFYEDQEFSIVPMAYARRFYAYDKPLYEYRVGDVNQSVSIESSLKRLDHYEKVIMRLIDAGNDAANFSKGGKALWFSKTSKFINDYMQLCLIRNSDKRQLRERMKHFVEQINDKNPEMYDCVNKNYRVFCALP